ncbi:MAG: HlyD family secretion protein [Alphaproteobacteria bacterium]|nr:HlyD family secretion protein [Alphaproteobacteria bacterium]MDE1985246.1 HlyD family secretion protein [Alphaproteobacteria bacterium]MDE2162585.1 HlyD family secretion protein [Alphaproteobacteria bacterium]MDE2266870.1 HlyD family secretion protein [Alphaproteobacteria bacterium]
MSAIPGNSIANAYDGVVRGHATRVRSWAGELWADKPRLRRVAMISGVAAVAAVSLVAYLTGGRYVGTDDSYVHAAKLMVTTDVSGLVKSVDVTQGEHVKKGQILFQLDPRPFQIAVDNAKAALDQSVLDIESMEATYKGMLAQVTAQQAQVSLAQTTYNRDLSLAKANAIASLTLDQARSTLQSAQATLVSIQENARTELAKLNGNPNLPPQQAPQYQQAQAALAEAQRQLNHATVRAPFEGDVTEVDSLQPGTLVISALSAFTTTSAVGLVSSSDVWISANMKETDLTHVRVGDPVSIAVDTYPGHTWHGHVDAVSQASDSAFSALPSENASSNWVKVVQRIPVRIKLDLKPGDPPLRAGMSTVVTIDTHHRRWYRLFFGN